MSQEVQPFCIRRHQSVLDPVVNHFHEMARAMSATVQVPLRRRTLLARGPAGTRIARRQGRKDRIERLHRLRLSSDHQAEAILEPEHAAAGSHVDIVDTGGLQLVRAPDIVVIV